MLFSNVSEINQQTNQKKQTVKIEGDARTTPKSLCTLSLSLLRMWLIYYVQLHRKRFRWKLKKAATATTKYECRKEEEKKIRSHKLNVRTHTLTTLISSPTNKYGQQPNKLNDADDENFDWIKLLTSSKCHKKFISLYFIWNTFFIFQFHWIDKMCTHADMVYGHLFLTQWKYNGIEKQREKVNESLEFRFKMSTQERERESIWKWKAKRKTRKKLNKNLTNQLTAMKRLFRTSEARETIFISPFNKLSV